MAATTLREAVAAFDDPEALKAAVSDLQSNGFDRADISSSAAARTPNADAETRALEILRRHAGHDVHVHELPAAG